MRGTDARALLIWGAGGHARVVADIARCQGGWNLVGLVDELAPHQPVPWAGGMLTLGPEALDQVLESHPDCRAVVAIGKCEPRWRLGQSLKSRGFSLATLCHPSAVIAADVTIGEGSVLVAGSVINPGCRLGEGVLVNTRAVIDHDSEVDDAVHVGPGALLTGRTRVGRLSWIGASATVIEKVAIGDQCLVGAGALVLHPIPDRSKAYGVPARVVGPFTHYP